MQPCDNRSVGILVFRNDELLLIDRKRPPFGLAAPAGHVDNHGDTGDSEEAQFEKAAMAELKEETGLMTISLKLLAEGRKDNPCRRGGTWHYWKVYRAESEGHLNLSEEETLGHLWCNKQQIQGLLSDKSLQIEARDVFLEPIWKDWLSELL